MNLDLSSFNSLYRSWLSGFVESTFRDTHLYIDSYSGVEKITQTSKTKNKIIYIDDEDQNFWIHFLQSNQFENAIIICKVKNVYNELSKIGYKCLYYPYWHIIDDIIAVNKLGNLNKVLCKSNDLYSYCCLNRNITVYRTALINELIAQNLIDYGYVTYHGKSLNTKVTSDVDLMHYTNNMGSFERHNHVKDGIGYSSNVANYFFIKENIPAPINISAETTMDPFFPTEKSFLAFFTGKIPIILSENGRVSDLRNEGFDMFDDIIDHSYDSASGNLYRIKKAISDNKEILKNFDTNISNRIDFNLEFLLNDWFNKKLKELVDGINELF